MPITLKKKKEIVADLENKIKSAKSLVFVKFDKLSVSLANSLRRKLQGEGVSYVVTKKTLLKRVLDNEKTEGTMPELSGQVAIAYGEDSLAPSREIWKFAKDNKENVSIIGGIFEGEYKDQEEMTSIATIPPLQTLRGMFVNLINSPIQRLAIVLDQVAQTKN